MKQFTFSYLRQLFLLVAAFCSYSVSFGQGTDEWGVVESNDLAGEEQTKIEDPVFFSGSVMMYPSEMVSGKTHTVTISPNDNSEYVAVKVDVADAGTYKYSFDVKGEADDQAVQLYYDAASSDLSNKVSASDAFSLSTEVQTLESNELELQAGTYYFAVQVTDPGFDYGFISLANFKLSKKGAVAPVDAYTVTWSEDIDGGSLSVVYKDNESTVVVNGVTKVPAGTWLKVINAPDSGKELKSLKVETDLGVVDLSAPYEFELTDNVELIAEFGDEGPKKPVVTWSVFGTKRGWATTTINVGGTEIVRVFQDYGSGDFEVEAGTTVELTTFIEEDGLAQGTAATVIVNGVEHKLDIEGKCSFVVNEDTELSVKYDVKQYNVTFNKTPADKGTVVLEYDGGTTGYQLINANTKFKVIATPEDGWQTKFVKVTIGDVVATPVDGVYTATGDVVVDVEFVEEGTEITYNVTVEKPENGNLAVTYTDADGAEQTVDTSAFGTEETEKSFTVEPESVLKVTVTPAAGYELDVLSPEMTKKTEGDETYYEYTVNADVTVNATFKQFGSLTLEGFEESEGSVVVEASVGDEWKAVDLTRIAVGTELRLTVKAAENYEVASVMNGDTEIVKNADGYYYFKLETAAATLTVTFKPVACKVTVTGFEATEGSVLVEAGNEGAWAKVEDLENVAFGTELRLTVTAAEKYEVESVKKGSEAIAKGTDGFYLLTVDAKEVTVTVKFKQSTSIDKVSAAGVYYNEEVLYTAGAASVNVYDLTGSVVLSAENVEALNVSELPAGVYVAAVDGVTVKFCK